MRPGHATAIHVKIFMRQCIRRHGVNVEHAPDSPALARLAFVTHRPRSSLQHRRRTAPTLTHLDLLYVESVQIKY